MASYSTSFQGLSQMSEEFKTILKRIRKDFKITQSQLAREINREHSSISKYESESGSIPPTIADDIVEALSSLGIPPARVKQLQDAAKRMSSKPKQRNTEAREYLVTNLSNKLEKATDAELDEIFPQINAIVDLHNDLKHVETLMAERMWKKALEKLDAMLASESNTHTARKYELLKRKSELHYNLGRYQEAVVFGSQAQDLLNQLSGGGKLSSRYRNDKIQLHLRVGGAERRLAHWRKAEREYTNMEKLITDNTSLAKCRRKLASVLILRGKHKEALDVCEKTLNELEGRDDFARYDASKLEQHKAWALSLIGDWDGAIELYKSAENKIVKIVSDTTDRDIEVARSKKYLADVLRLNPIWRRKAEKYYNQAIDILDGIQAAGRDEIVLLKAANYRGLSYILARKTPVPDNIIDVIEMRQYPHIYNEPLSMNSIYLDKGVALRNLGLYSDAELFIESAIDGFTDIGNLYYVSAAISQLAKLYQEMNDNIPEQQDKIMEKAQGIRHIIRNGSRKGMCPLYLGKTLLHIAEIYYKNHSHKESMHLFSQAIEEAASFNRYALNETLNIVEKYLQNYFITHKKEEAKELYYIFIGDLKEIKNNDNNNNTAIDEATARILLAMKLV